MTEVLAPAGSPEAVIAAVRAGADAVYFGAPGFNARRNARNFTFDDIISAARYSRVRGVKTYLTLNTLVSDEERKEALLVAQKAAEAGVDALIVQDIGLARLLKKHLPAMPLHASTQLSVHSADALERLKSMGFERVVPAREMDKAALISLCRRAAELGLEVEVFVHGALCMCLSGQCCLSSVLGGRSGNRGLCAQPCRLEFSAPGGTGHDLSLKDMSLIGYIGELTEMGVSSFKIEGRMKRTEYVAAATAVCRAAADGRDIPADAAEMLSGVFSRSGHTDGYYTGKLGRDMFGIRTAADEQLSAKLLTATHELYRRERQSVALSGKLTFKTGQPSKLEISDGEGHYAAVCGDVPEKAERAEVKPEFLRQKLAKCGGTCYYFKELDCETDGGPAFSGAALGELRRRAFEKMEAARGAYDGSRVLGSTVDEYAPQSGSRTVGVPKTAAQFRSLRQVPEELSGISAVILPAECDFGSVNMPAGIEVIADIPRGIMHSGEKIVGMLANARENGVKAAVCGNIASFEYAERAGLVPIAGFGMNIFNTDSVCAAEELGSKAAVLSFELAAERVNRLGGKIPIGVITYGRLPLMIFRNCPGKNGGGCSDCGGKCVLTDRKGIEFPVMCRGEFSELYNSRVLWMLDRRSELKGADFQVLMFTDESRERCAEVISAAANGAPPDCEYTRGLYYREVL